MNRRTFLIAATGVGASVAVGRRPATAQQNKTTTPTPTPSSTPTQTPTSSPTPTQTPTQTPQQTQEPTRTPTPEEDTPTSTDNPFEDDSETPQEMEFAEMRYDPPGHDHLYNDEEWVEFRNPSERWVQLENCTIADSDNQLYEFDDLLLGGERTVRVYTGKGESDDDEEVYMGYGRAVWNNDGDTVYFYNADGELLVEESYSGDCESGYHPCRERRRSTATPTPNEEATPTRTVARTRSRSRATPTAERTRSSDGSTRDRATSDSTPPRTTPTAREREESTPFSVGGDSPTRTPSRATDTATATPTATAEADGQQPAITVADDGTTTGDGPGFGAIATLGGFAAATAHLLKRADEFNEED